MRFFLLCLLLPTMAFSLPVLSQGRIRPLQADADSWLFETYHSSSIRKEHKDLLPFPTANSKEILWSLTVLGHEPWDDFPLFYVKGNWYSYRQLKVKMPESIHQKLTVYEQLGTVNRDPNVPLSRSSAGIKLLPARSDLGLWLPINTLELTQRNFTPYPKEFWQEVRNLYEKLPAALQSDYTKAVSLEQKIESLLDRNYQQIAGMPYRTGTHSRLFLPSVLQLQAESLYFQFPWIEAALLIYGLSLVLLGIKRLAFWGIAALTAAFLIHTIVLAMRCFILWRPPVSNMLETVMYVPWIAILFGFILWYTFKHRALLSASAALGLIFLSLLFFTYPRHELENVQAVLNSQYWLTIHVLMVVGSYGAFALSGIISHDYLVRRLFHPPSQEKNWILQSLYIGVALLITGTILGGVWAAQSWGRFWDWDPKESWAFISSCLYLIVIHAYRFGKIGDIGLAVGSIIGLQAITFTWYGVNYILGVGLHSYGFGNGGELFYAGFIAFEIIFISFMLYFHQKLPKNHQYPL